MRGHADVFQLQVQYYPIRPDVGGPKWNIQLQATPTIPALIKKALFGLGKPFCTDPGSFERDGPGERHGAASGQPTLPLSGTRMSRNSPCRCRLHYPRVVD